MENSPTTKARIIQMFEPYPDISELLEKYTDLDHEFYEELEKQLESKQHPVYKAVFANDPESTTDSSAISEKNLLPLIHAILFTAQTLILYFQDGKTAEKLVSLFINKDGYVKKPQDEGIIDTPELARVYLLIIHALSIDDQGNRERKAEEAYPQLLKAWRIAFEISAHERLATIAINIGRISEGITIRNPMELSKILQAGMQAALSAEDASRIALCKINLAQTIINYPDELRDEDLSAQEHANEALSVVRENRNTSDVPLHVEEVYALHTLAKLAIDHGDAKEAIVKVNEAREILDTAKLDPQLTSDNKSIEAEALIIMREFEQAERILLDLFKQLAPNPNQDVDPDRLMKIVHLLRVSGTSRLVYKETRILDIPRMLDVFEKAQALALKADLLRERTDPKMFFLKTGYFAITIAGLASVIPDYETARTISEKGRDIFESWEDELT